MQAIYISAELSSPSHQLPLAINTAVPAIIICFITANAAYYILLPWDVVSTTDSVAVVRSFQYISINIAADFETYRLL
jgi:solute carrier family 7 (L-type amino acid transporter), member 9/15